MRFYCLLILLCCSTSMVLAQGDAVQSAKVNTQMWDEVCLTHVLKKVVLETSLQYNTGNGTAPNYQITNEALQYGLYASVHYYLKPRLKFTGSIGIWHNLEVSDIGQSPSNEYRPTLQFQHFIVRKKFTFYNRVRIEDRFIHNLTTDHMTQSYRLRYMPKLLYAINSNSIRKKSLYLILSDELFGTVNQGKWIDQNLFTIGLGYCISDNIVLETTYANQYRFYISPPNELTHALGVSITINNFINVFSGKEQ